MTSAPVSRVGWAKVVQEQRKRITVGRITSQNFSHLEEIDAPLAMLGSHAERYFVDDANTAEILPVEQQERNAKKAALKEELTREAQGKMSNKKKKRLEKYIVRHFAIHLLRTYKHD